MIPIAIIFGILLSAGFSYMVTMILIRKSNDSGDSTATFFTYTGDTVHMLDSQDGVDPYRYL